jgi:hypothetical protein
METENVRELKKVLLEILDTPSLDPIHPELRKKAHDLDLLLSVAESKEAYEWLIETVCTRASENYERALAIKKGRR